MSKRKGPVLINDLLPKLAKQTSQPVSAATQSPVLESAKSAYQFISQGYKDADQIGTTTKVPGQTDKTGSNRVQNGFKSGLNQVHKPVQNGFKSGSEKNPQKEPSAKSGSQTGSTLVQIGFKSGSNQVQNSPFSTDPSDVLTIRGSQRQILELLFDLRLKSGDHATPYLSSSEIGNTLQMPQETVRTALKRLQLRGVILRKGFQRGRTGWSCYELSQKAYRDLREIRQSGSNQVHIGFKSGSEIGSQSGSTVPSSSSFVLNKDLKTTTTDEPELINDSTTQLSPEWQTVDFTPLTEIGLTQTHLLQIIRQGKLSASEIQDSIHFFAFDLKRNGKGKELNGPPLNYFMGILRKCIPYAPPENYESPADEARRKTREFKERKEREYRAEEQQLMALEFSEWRRELVADDLAQILPEFARKPGPLQESALKSYFETNVWPERAQEVLGLEKIDRAKVARQIEQSLEEVGR